MLISLQALRALAAWLVVFHHFQQVFFNFNAEGPIGQFFVDKGAVGVDIFFVISGLVIYLSTWDKDIAPKDFLLNRLLRIVPAYWLYSIIMALLLVYAGQLIPGQRVDWYHFILSLLFIPSENPSGYGLYPTLNVGWTLNYEMLFYALFAVAISVRQRHRPLLLGLALFAINEVLARQGLVSRFYSNNILYEFLFGVGIGMLYKRGWIVEGLWLPMIAIVVAALVIGHTTTVDRTLTWGVSSAMIVMACISMERYFKGNRVLKSLGDCSYSVYLLHVLVLYMGCQLSRRYGVDPYLMLLACVPVIGVAGWASYQLIEKRLYFRLKPPLAGSKTAQSFIRQNY